MERGPAGAALHRRPRHSHRGSRAQVPKPSAAAEPRLHLPRLPGPPHRRHRAGPIPELHALLLPGEPLTETCRGRSRGWCVVFLTVVVCLCRAVVLAGVPDGEDRTEPGDEL